MYYFFIFLYIKKMQKYKRSYEQNEEFGLNDIKTDNYEED